MRPLLSVMDEIRALIRNRDEFTVTGHLNPDGDAIGACCGLALALQKMGKRVRVVLEPYALKYNIIPGGHLRLAEPADRFNVGVLFCLDCASAVRLGAARSLLEQTEETVCIDHHMSNTGFARWNLLDGDASSTSELIYRLIETEVTLDRDIATALYAGILDDTGGFRFSATTCQTMEVAGRCMALGIPFTDIYTKLAYVHSFDEAKLLGRVLDACTCRLNGRIIYSCVTREMMNELGVTSKNLDGVVEYLMNTCGVEIAVLIYDRQEPEVKISMRSCGFNIGSIAARMGGGGHIEAAGFNMRGNIHEITETVLTLLERELSEHA